VLTIKNRSFFEWFVDDVEGTTAVVGGGRGILMLETGEGAGAGLGVELGIPPAIMASRLFK